MDTIFGGGSGGGAGGGTGGTGGGTESFIVSVQGEDLVAGAATFTGAETGNELTLNGETEVTILATANAGYAFTGWYKDDQLVSNDNPYTFTPTEAMALVAKFEVDLAPGLYDADNNQIADWETLTETHGMDVTQNYSTNSWDSKYVATHSSSPYSVLNNNYADALNAGVKLVLDDNITELGSSAFANCDGVTIIDLPDALTSISPRAFSSCTRLTSVTIPGSVTEIGNMAFLNCTGLTSVTIGNSVETIGGSMFNNCTSLTSVIFGDSVETIADYSFQDCTSLTSVTVLAETPPALDTIAFIRCSALTSIKVPAGSVDTYKSTPGWSTYTSKSVAIN